MGRSNLGVVRRGPGIPGPRTRRVPASRGSCVSSRGCRSPRCIGDLGADFVSRLPASRVDQLLLQGGEEGLGSRVVVGGANLAHRQADSVGPNELPESQSDVLRPLIALMDETLLRLPAVTAIFKVAITNSARM